MGGELDVVIDAVQRQLCSADDVRRIVRVNHCAVGQRTIVVIATAVICIGVERPVADEAGGDVEQPDPIGLHSVAYGHLRLDISGLSLQYPVATQTSITSSIDAGGHIGAGELAQ